VSFFDFLIIKKLLLKLAPTTTTKATTTTKIKTTATREKCNTDMCFNGGKIDPRSSSCSCECNYLKIIIE
jgi:hypothetical protein